MKHFTYFLNWWILFTLICAGSVASWYLGVFRMANTADVTKISFIIYVLFLAFTVRVGIYNYKFCKCKDVSYNVLDKFASGQEISWFVSDILLTLGMLGTILGYIYMIEVGFTAMDPSNMASMHAALKSMALGWGTALYTTASGLICSLLLKLQLFNTTRQLDQMERECGVISKKDDKTNATDSLPLQGLGV